MTALDGTIRTAVADGVGTVTIDRPARRNALSPRLCGELGDAMRALDANPAVAIIALRGAGDDFSAGADIGELPSVLFDGADSGAGVDHLSAADAAIGAVGKPTVALVRGVCMGGGWQIAAACDLVLAADDARLAVTPALLGIIYPRRGVERLVRMVGVSRAKYILFTADRIAPVDAERWGLVTALVPADRFEEDTAALLQRIRRRSPYTVHTTKALIDAAVENPDGVDALWEREWAGLPASPDLAVGRPAFLAGERPEFVWTPSPRDTSG